MYNNYTSNSDSSKRMKELVDGYKRFRSQTSQPTSLLRDKGEGMLTGEENKVKAPTQASYGDMLLGVGASAKQTVQSAYSKLYPNAKNKDLFGSIDEKEIENNMPLAKNVVEKNENLNPLNRSIFENLPYLKPGLATFYAAAFSGNYEAANAARKIAYSEDAGVSLAEGISPQTQTTESNKRYVNADIGLNVRSEAGTSNSIIGKLKKGTEVEFTGKKKPDSKGDAWAEIKYGDKTGWVVADCLNLKKPEATSENVPQSENNGGTRYVGEKTISMRVSPGFRSHTKATVDYGQRVEFTGNKENLDGIEWAEVKYGNKTGWVIADYLKTQRSPDMPYEADNSKVTEPPKNEKPPAQTTSKARDNNDATRYIGKNEIFLYESPTMASNIVRTGHLGEEVEFLGEKKKTNGFEWAKVNYKGKVGWVNADFLKLKRSASVIDKNVPEGMIVNQSMGSEDRTKYLNEKIPEWMAEKGGRPTDPNMPEWYKSKGANVKYTGTYCLPIQNISYISQGFYGSYSHAGKYDSANQKYIYETGYLGAVDIAAARYSPVYSVLEGKVVYTPSPGFDDFHRVTVETKINGETYYLEYLHLEDVNVKTGQILKMGDNVGTVGGWLRNGPSDKNIHLDFRIYKFTNENNKNFSNDSTKQFFDPFEFFDFDKQYGYELTHHDYN